MPYLLLTGATGLVGRYLLRDLLAADWPVAVLCRSSIAESASSRVESVMQYWERLAGCNLRRPVVLSGDLRQPLAGLSADDLGWVSRNCNVVLHSAASMNFREDKQGEPMRTNVDGMRNMLDLCRQTGIRQFHHVSTAYVCGLREGLVREDELDLGQQNGNIYEVSKLTAEKLLRAAGCFDRVTVYRPASVVGDSRSGYTTSSHGFYLPLQLAFLTADKVPPQLMGERFLKLLGLRGDEGKNLVPVDWLAAAITYLVMHPERHGRTYHLTHPQPVKVSLIQQVVQEAIEQYIPRKFTSTLSESEIAAYEALFLQMMEVYRSHWRDDPVFDRTWSGAAIGHLACPELNHERMLRVASYPVRHNFVLKRSHPVEIPFRAADHLQQLVGQATPRNGGPNGSSQDAPLEPVGLEVSGRGGGQWRVSLRGGEVVSVEQGLGDTDAVRFYLSSHTLSALVAGRTSVAAALGAGRIVVEGSSAIHERGAARDWTDVLERIVGGAAAPVALV